MPEYKEKYEKNKADGEMEERGNADNTVHGDVLKGNIENAVGGNEVGEYVVGGNVVGGNDVGENARAMLSLLILPQSIERMLNEEMRDTDYLIMTKIDIMILNVFTFFVFGVVS
ncbi:uncharacterized protein LOC143452582 [Clavelina lepadiformis]|uniref:uncharacterized protein LOC143452582 n=1 Tax=Clavelina lepadiformis TaxID=159417 RepID=UPI004043783A